MKANGEPSDLYWEHLWEHEVILLRDVLIERIKRLEPGWLDVFNKSQRETSILQCKLAIMRLLLGIYAHGSMTSLLG
jgi:hypothetical protein